MRQSQWLTGLAKTRYFGIMSELSNSPEPKEMPFVQHLLELRDRILKMALAVMIVALVAMPFANQLFVLVAKPLMQVLPMGAQMVSNEPIGPFFTPLKLTLVLSIFLSMPFILYHFWAFVAPGLYQHERQLIYPLLISSVILFYVGILFAYWLVLPLVFGFMVSTTPVGVVMMTDISRYLDFVLTLFFAFGIAFQVPIITIVFVWMDIVTAESLSEKRSYIIVMAFVIGMFLTPPDVISQTLLSVPIWLLFEAGLVIARFLKAKQRAREESTELANYPLTKNLESPGKEIK